jgi:hypothetical protein
MWKYIHPASYVALEPWSPSSARKAKTWLDNCSMNHAGCFRDRIRTPLPTRLVDVGSSNQDPFVYEITAGECGTYACLSYCWGKTWTFTSTLSTIQERKSGFHLEDLPKTLRDAIVAARTLSIQYLWIDQLCIIQDSTADWEVEAANMCSIYANSIITFAALDSPDTKTGLFNSNSKRARIGGVVLDVPIFSHGTTGRAYAREQPAPTRLGFGHDMGEQLRLFQQSGILNSRLWTFQETILSRRILWFSSYELGWTCLEERACECQPIPIPTKTNGSALELPYWLQFSKDLRGHLVNRNWLNLWGRTVQEATERSTSHQTDRLPAMAGLAADMQKHVGGRYLAGLWERQLDISLLWYCRHYDYEAPSEVMSPILQDYAPSWTWASVSGPIIMELPYLEDEVKPLPLWRVVTVDFKPTTLNIYGPAKGILTLEGVLIPLIAVYEYGSELSSILIRQGTDAGIGDFLGMTISKWNLDRRHITSGAVSLNEKNLFLAFAGFRHDEYNKKMHREGDGLLLERVQSPNPLSVGRDPDTPELHDMSLPSHVSNTPNGCDVYQRIGHLEVSVDDDRLVEIHDMEEWRLQIGKFNKIFHII